MNLVLMAKCFRRELFDVNVVVLADISFETVVWSAFFLSYWIFKYKPFSCCIVGLSYDMSQIFCLLQFNNIRYVSGLASFEKNLIRNGELIIICLIESIPEHLSKHCSVADVTLLKLLFCDRPTRATIG